MGAVANTIDNKLRTRFAPSRLAIEDESHKHAGHVGHREGGETCVVCLDQASEPAGSLVWIEWEGEKAVRGGWGLSGV